MTAPYVLGIRNLENEYELITVGKEQVELNSKCPGDSDLGETAVQLGVGLEKAWAGLLTVREDFYKGVRFMSCLSDTKWPWHRVHG